MTAKVGERDQARTGFSGLLDVLLADLPEAVCAVFVDNEGETVDLATRIDAFDARITGAEFAIVLAMMRGSCDKLGQGAAVEARVEGTHRSIYARSVSSDGYDLVVLIDGPISARAAELVVSAAEKMLAEAGLTPPATFARLRSVEQRPSRVGFVGPLLLEENGTRRRVEAVLGFSRSEEGVEVLVRMEDGEELVVFRDERESRWKRRAIEE